MSDAVEPFRIETSDEQLEDLRDRLRRTRWPEAETVDDWSQGIPLSNELDRGGHFAAFEQPELFVGELRSFFALVR